MRDPWQNQKMIRPPILERYQNYMTEQKIPLFILTIWVLYLVLSPFYVFPKGRPQPADFILMMGIIPILSTMFLSFKIRKIKTVYVIGALFVLTTIGINFINYMFFPDIRFLLTMMIYPYNFCVFLFVVWLFQKDYKTAKNYSFYALIVTILIQLAVIQFFDFGYRGYRGTGGFENPNQLAYWTLLTGTMLIFLKRDEKLKLIDWLLLCILGFFQALALSKAGLIAYGLLIGFLFLTPKISRKAYIIFFSVIVMTIFYLVMNPTALNQISDSVKPVEHVVERIQGIGSEPDDSVEARGYYRIIEYPLYTLLGAGEGAFARFDKEGYVREIHSGIATILFSYGLIGFTLFTCFLMLVAYRQPWYYILLCLPIILFGLPHQNFRFAHFWVFLGINYGLFLAKRQEKLIEGQKNQRIS